MALRKAGFKPDFIRGFVQKIERNNQVESVRKACSVSPSQVDRQLLPFYSWETPHCLLNNQRWLMTIYSKFYMTQHSTSSRPNRTTGLHVAILTQVFSSIQTITPLERQGRECNTNTE